MVFSSVSINSELFCFSPPVGIADSPLVRGGLWLCRILIDKSEFYNTLNISIRTYHC